MSNKSQGIGLDLCVKCGAADSRRTWVEEKQCLSLTCNFCGFNWSLAALDAPAAAPATEPGGV